MREKEAFVVSVYAGKSVNNFQGNMSIWSGYGRSLIDRPSSAINPLIAKYRSITVDRDRDRERERGREGERRVRVGA